MKPYKDRLAFVIKEQARRTSRPVTMEVDPGVMRKAFPPPSFADHIKELAQAMHAAKQNKPIPPEYVTQPPEQTMHQWAAQHGFGFDWNPIRGVWLVSLSPAAPSRETSSSPLEPSCLGGSK